MTSAISTPPIQPQNASTIAIAIPSQNAPRNTTPVPAVPAQLPETSSHANATKPDTSRTPQAQKQTSTGPKAPVQHGKVDTHNSTVSMSAASAAAGNPPTGNPKNDLPRTDSHGRKPSVVISATGASGQIPNGGPVQSTAHPNLAFGSLKAADPRVTSPAHSPSPIPQPPASGGKPPQNISTSGNGLVFGSSSMENGDANFRASQGPLTPSQQPAHLRRESSQSARTDMSGSAVPAARPYMGNSGPGGRGPYMSSSYGNPQSPGVPFRQPSNPRGPPAMPGQFQGQAGMGASAYRGRNSPAVMHAQPHIPQAMPHNQQNLYGGYPQHAAHQGYNMYMQPQYDPNQGHYQPYFAQQGYYPSDPTPRPAHGYPAPYGGPPPTQPPYHGPNMSRSASQVSERPGSSMGSRPPTAANIPPPSTPQSTATAPPPVLNFVKPQKQSKAIVIKNAAGEEVKFDKKSSPAPAVHTPVAAPAPPQSPAIVSSAPTPPPRTPSTTNQHNRTESRSAKTDAEIKNGFQEQVKRQIEAQKEAERKKHDGETPPVSLAKDGTTPAAAAAATTPPAAPEAKGEPVGAVKQTVPKTEAGAVSQADGARAVTKAEAPSVVAPTETAEEKKAREQREKDEEFERMVAEMEAAEKAEQERERKHQEKRKAEAEEKKKQEAEAARNADAEMKRLEKEAEELELKREKERQKPAAAEDEQAKVNRELFASLKKPSLGPGATGAEAPGTPATEEAPSPTTTEAELMAPPRSAGTKPKPNPLKLRTDKPVEPPQPTPGMQALKSARLLDLQRESIAYPDGIQSPNPALNNNGKRGGSQYDKTFLLQFQEVFKEKPTIDWDQKVKETLGDGEPGSARPANSRQSSVSMGSRQPSNRGSAMQFQTMGSFGGNARGTTSSDRFAASQRGGAMGSMGSMGGFGSGRGGFPMAANMSRQSSLQPMGQGGNPPSPRPGGSRGGRGGSRRGPADRNMSRKEEEASNKQMPLTAGMELKTLEKSATGWTARSITQGAGAGGVTPDGMMPPDMVQRKVKAALNKMTPEKFEKISDQIMEIANQSRTESDGRTLRQVIQLTFEKACDEAHWAGMYAKFCQKMMMQMSNEIKDEAIQKNGVPITGGGLFRKYLLNRCQEEFERGWEANLPDKPEGDTEEAALLSDEYYIAAAAKRKGLGLIQFIGELYKLSMLTYRIMHQCVLRLLNFEGTPDESAVENLCRLLRTVGSTMDTAEDPQCRALVNVYFERIDTILAQNKDMPSRPRFMLMDILDLRKNGWKDKAGSKGPKTIQEIHAEAEAAQAAAEAERQRQNQRGGRVPGGRGDARSFSSQGMPPPDYNRNNVAMDDLRKLHSRNQPSRTTSSGLGPSLGPGSSLFQGRTGSGRRGLGPPGTGDLSGNTSRTNTPPAKKEDKESSAQTNAFSALAGLDNEGGEAARSPPGEKASPAVAKVTPSIDEASNAPNGS